MNPYNDPKSNPPSEFGTSDLYFSAFLKARQVPMLRADKVGSKVTFVFDTSGHNIEEFRKLWWDRKDMVSARTFSEEVKNLKSICHN